MPHVTRRRTDIGSSRSHLTSEGSTSKYMRPLKKEPLDAHIHRLMKRTERKNAKKDDPVGYEEDLRTLDKLRGQLVEKRLRESKKLESDLYWLPSDDRVYAYSKSKSESEKYTESYRARARAAASLGVVSMMRVGEEKRAQREAILADLRVISKERKILKMRMKSKFPIGKLDKGIKLCNLEEKMLSY